MATPDARGSRTAADRAGYRITYHGSAFGDNLMSAFLVATLRDNGINALLDNPKIAHLVDCPLASSDDVALRAFDCVRRNRTGLDTSEAHNVYTDLVTQFRTFSGIQEPIQITRDHVPVRWHEMPEVPVVDVMMVTETGLWTPYRNWPHFEELKSMLHDAGVAHVDASKEKIRDVLFLNYVKRARLYLGLETGASHYASRFANGKALILQSGYCDFEYWAGAYRFEKIEASVDCSPCWLRSCCPHTYRCMVGLAPRKVFDRIMERLSRS